MTRRTTDPADEPTDPGGDGCCGEAPSGKGGSGNGGSGNGGSGNGGSGNGGSGNGGGAANGGSGNGGASKSARTRERLLDAAAKVLSRKGFAGTRLADIAEQAHVQAPAIYYYYASREDLIEEVMFVGAAAMRTHLVDALAALPAETSPEDRIAAAVEAHLRHELEISEYATAMIRNANQLPESVSKRALAEVGAYNAIWRGLITDLDEAGRLREDVDPAAGRMLVLGALNWAAEWWDPEGSPLEQTIRTAQSMVLHALRP